MPDHMTRAVVLCSGFFKLCRKQELTNRLCRLIRG